MAFTPLGRGNVLWTRQFGTGYDSEAEAVTVDFQGNIVVVGGTGGVLPGQTSAGRWDAFIRKYDPHGDELWTKQFGTSEDDAALDVAVDPRGNVVVVGYTRGVLLGQTSAGRADAFVRKYSP